MARVKHTSPGGTFLGMSHYPKPKPQPKPDTDIETDSFTEEDATRVGAVLYNLVREAIEQATTPISSVEPEDCEHHVAETANTRNESRPSRSAGPGPSNSRVETNPARREITDPTTGPETVVDTPKATTAQQAPAVQGSDSPNLLLRPLKRKLKDLEAGWEEKEYVSKLKHRLSDVKERNAELVEYVVELEGMVEALQAELAGK